MLRRRKVRKVKMLMDLDFLSSPSGGYKVLAVTDTIFKFVIEMKDND
jgi:hypothetical protein